MVMNYWIIQMMILSMYLLMGKVGECILYYENRDQHWYNQQQH